MKLPATSLVSLPIAATIGAVCFSVNAQAQTPNNVPIDENITLERCIDTASRNQKFQIIICNATKQPLKLVGRYNDNSGWPLGDVPAITAQHVDFVPFPVESFSFAANYAVGETGRFFQVGASKPPRGNEKVNVCDEQSAGDGAARKCWNSMSDDNRKVRNVAGYTLFSEKHNRGGRTQWIFWLR